MRGRGPGLRSGLLTDPQSLIARVQNADELHPSHEETTMSNAVYSIITDRVVSLLERGIVPWRKPWGGPDGMPRNLVSKREYRGLAALPK